MAATKFLGASVSQYNSTLGWGGQASQLNVTLVEDTLDGDLFSPPPVGTPVYFQFGGQSFGGILQNYRKVSNPSGNPIYEVSIIDPREILSGVQLILNGYVGTTYGMPNIINVYGYLEAFGFGYSQAQTTGIPWTSVIAALNAMVAAGYGGIFGNTITLRGHNYELDLSQIPMIPSYYRIGGDSITLMDFIHEVCEAGACDYFFTLNYVNNTHFITLHTVSRGAQLTQFGKITEFVNSVNAVSKDSGFEFVNATTGKFVVGGNVVRMWYNYLDGFDNEEYQGVWPFWGLDFDGNAVVGETTEDDHNMTLDARQVNAFGINSFYKTSVNELRAVLSSQSSWESYLIAMNDVNGPHYQKAEKLGIVSNIGDVKKKVQENQASLAGAQAAVGGSLASSNSMKISQFAPVKKKNIQKATEALLFDELKDENIKRVYEYLRSYAQQYLGKRFMVRIPFLYSKVDEAGNIITSQAPTDAGYIPEDQFYSAYANNLLPMDVNSLMTEDGRIIAYARFDNAQKLDFSELDPESLIPGQTNGGQFSMFVKCTVFPNPVYLNSYTGYSPRAVIELPGCVKEKTAAFNENIRLIYDGILGGAAEAAYAATYGQFGSDNFFSDLMPKPYIPNICAVPLESRVLTYGPWFAVGADGKMEFEKDDSLVPWNFGDWTAMNYAGNARVASALAQNQLQEFGQVEFAGTPQINLGGILVNGGPYVTDVTVNISEAGITTVYTMNSWSGNYFKLLRAQVDRYTQLSKNAQQMRRNFREALKRQRVGGQGYYNSREWAFASPRRSSHSSHAMICGELVKENDEKFSANVVIQPYYNTITQLDFNYKGKAAMSLDGLFRPFSTDYNTTLLSHFEEPVAPSGEDVESSGTSPSGEETKDEPTSKDLNPFSPVTDINICVTGDELPDSLLLDDISTSEDTAYRGLALRGPMVISGWGYDTDGYPVPNESEDDEEAEPTEEFYPNHRIRPDLWKCGPVDIRWDRDRKVWVAGGGGKAIIVKIVEGDDFPKPTESRSEVREGDFRKVYKAKKCKIKFEKKEGADVEIEEDEKEIFVANFRSNIIMKNQYYVAFNINNKWFIDNQATFLELMES